MDLGAAGLWERMVLWPELLSVLPGEAAGNSGARMLLLASEIWDSAISLKSYPHCRQVMRKCNTENSLTNLVALKPARTHVHTDM